jgi:chromosome segregation ATPase
MESPGATSTPVAKGGGDSGQEKKLKQLLLKLKKELAATKDKCSAAEKAQAAAEKKAKTFETERDQRATELGGKVKELADQASGSAAATASPEKTVDPGQEKKLKQMLLKLKKELAAQKEKVATADADAAAAAAAAATDAAASTAALKAEHTTELAAQTATIDTLTDDLDKAKADLATVKAELAAAASSTNANAADSDAASAAAAAAAATATEATTALSETNAALTAEVVELRAELGGWQATAKEQDDEMQTLRRASAKLRTELKDAVDAADSAAAAVTAAVATAAAADGGAEEKDRITAWSARVFVAADKDGNGKLSKNEIKKYFKAKPEVKKVLLGADFKWQAFFVGMDTDGDGSFDLDEFTNASLALAAKQEVGGSSSSGDAGGAIESGAAAAADTAALTAAHAAELAAHAGTIETLMLELATAKSARESAEATKPVSETSEAEEFFDADSGESNAALQQQIEELTAAVDLAKSAQTSAEEQLAAAGEKAEAAGSDRAAVEERLKAAVVGAAADQEALVAAQAATVKVQTELDEKVAQFTAYKEAMRGEASDNVNALTAELAETTVARDAALDKVNSTEEALAAAEEAAAAAASESESQLTEAAGELEKQHSANKGLRDVLAAERKERDGSTEESQEELRQAIMELTGLRAKQQQLDVSKARLETQLSQEQEDHASTKAALTASSADGTKSTMLDLELADYKRTADTLQSKVTDLESQLELERVRVKGGDESTKELETQLAKHTALKSKDEETRQKLKALLLKAKKEITEKRDDLKAGKALEEQLKSQLEDKTQEVEAVKTELTSVTVELDRAETEKREALVVLEGTLRTTQFELETARRDLATAVVASSEMEEEFSSYKIRAYGFARFVWQN